MHVAKGNTAVEMNPKGIPAQSPGLWGTSYPGKPGRRRTTPTGLRRNDQELRATLLGLEFRVRLTQGSSLIATLGWRTQSLWDCSIACQRDAGGTLVSSESTSASRD